MYPAHKWLSRMLNVFFLEKKMNSFNLLLLSIVINFENLIADCLSGGFVYRGNVSYSDVSRMISETGPIDVSLRYCAAECLSRRRNLFGSNRIRKYFAD